MTRPHSAGPLVVAVVLLLLPVFYIASYLALVSPGESRYLLNCTIDGQRLYLHRYRYFGECSISKNPPAMARIAPVVFWPLEQIDRKVRPKSWRVAVPLCEHLITPRIIIVEEDEERLGIDFEE